MNALAIQPQPQLYSFAPSASVHLYATQGIDPDTGQPWAYLHAPLATDKELIGLFLDDADPKPSTAKAYKTCLRQFALWLSDIGTDTPVRDDIKAYRAHLAEAGLAVGTQSQYLGCIKRFFAWTESENIYPNIAENIKGITIRHDIHRKDALDRDDVPKIAATIDRSTETGRRDYAIYLLCITCGLRCIEVHRADVGDLKTVSGKKYLYIQGKGHDDKDAPVLIIPEVQAALDDYLQHRETKATAKSPLFVSTSNRSKGERIATTTISTMIKRILVQAGYDSDRLTAHSLRHTSGTGAYMATGNIYLAQKHQRHASPETTEIYVHAEERGQRITEQQVYNYYFKGDSEATERETAAQLIEALDADKLGKVIDFIKAIQ